MQASTEEKRHHKEVHTTQKLETKIVENMLNHTGVRAVDNSSIIPTSIGNVYSELSKMHLLSLMGEKIPKIRLMTLELIKNETTLEVDDLDELGIGVLNPTDPADEVASCILIGKTVIVPTTKDEFGIITEQDGLYFILCDMIIDTEFSDIPIKRVSQLD